MHAKTQQWRPALPAAATPDTAAAPAKTVALYASARKIYPRSVGGTFHRWRWALVWLTQIIFYGLPWLQWGQRPLVLLDLPSRRFYGLGWVLYPQDFIYLTGLLIFCALALFLCTALAGRLWCGFACPQTVYTALFVRIERWVEGERSARMRLDRSPWGAEKLAKKSLKHLLWLALSLWSGFTLVGYFVPIGTLGRELLALQGGWQIFWVLLYGALMYAHAGHLREQVCQYMCPYARFQSALIDKDTLVVSYDAQRGEPRGARPASAQRKAQGLGACIDCKLCVQVCPVGVDIRQGLQYGCINCGLCADACHSVMQRVQGAPSLVGMRPQQALAPAASRWRAVVQRTARPRVLVYGALWLALGAAMAAGLALRQPLKVDVLRDRAALARMAAGGQLENVYRLQIMNATETAQTYRVQVQGMAGLHLPDNPLVEVQAVQTRGVAVRVQLPDGAAPAGAHPITFGVQALSGQGQVHASSVFIVPR